jgi:hypothetical protein
MKLIYFLILSFTMANDVFAMDGLEESHRREIKKAIAASKDDPRNLEKCQSNWKFYPEKRAAFSKAASSLSHNGPVLIVEMGSISFSRYDFLIVDLQGGKSSFRRTDFKLSEKLTPEIASIFKMDASWNEDRGSLAERDSNCFFISIIEGSRQQGLAVYGTPQSARLNNIVKELLRLVY